MVTALAMYHPSNCPADLLMVIIKNAGDCNDEDPEINPDADELCDDVDHNCDGFTDRCILMLIRGTMIQIVMALVR